MSSLQEHVWRDEKAEADRLLNEAIVRYRNSPSEEAKSNLLRSAKRWYIAWQNDSLAIIDLIFAVAVPAEPSIDAVEAHK